MSKPDSYPVPGGAEKHRAASRDEGRAQQDPMSGSKKVKQANHSRHNNGEG